MIAQPTPVFIRAETVDLADPVRVVGVFGVPPSRLREWERLGCPISHPDGRGAGKRAIAVVDDVLSWLRSRQAPTAAKSEPTIEQKLASARLKRRERKGELRGFNS